MKIAAKEIDNFLKSPPPSIKAILIYGPNNGLVHFRLAQLIEKKELAQKYNYDQVKNNPEIILDSFNSLSLFNTKSNLEKIITVECNGPSINESFSKFLKNTAYKGLLVLYANELGPDSNIRKLFENPPNFASIACYQDESSTVIKLIQQIFKERQIIASYDFVSALANYIPTNDRLLILSEIEKICLFLSSKKNFDKKDLEEYLELQSEVNIESLCYLVSLKQYKNIDSQIDKLQKEGNNLVALIRSLIRHFYRIFQVKQLIETGIMETQATSTLTPPLFFKRINDFSNSLKIWSKSDLQTFLNELNKAELLAKKSPLIAETFFKNMLLQIIISKSLT